MEAPADNQIWFRISVRRSGRKMGGGPHGGRGAGIDGEICRSSLTLEGLFYWPSLQRSSEFCGQAGFGSSNLVVLETRVVYSVRNLKSAARFFILQCSQSFSIKNQVPLKLLVESLQGPLAEKSHCSWTATPVVEFYHMLPYAEHISCWLSRKDLSLLPSLNCCNAKIATNNSEKEIKKSKILVLPHKNFNGEELDHRDSDNSRPKANSFQKIGFDIKKVKQASCGNNKSAVNVFQKKANSGNSAEKFNRIHDILDSAKKPGKRDDLYEGLLSDSSIEIQKTSLNDLTASCRESDDCSKNLDSNLIILS